MEAGEALTPSRLDAARRDGSGRDGSRRDGSGRDGSRRDGSDRDGSRRDGTGRDGGREAGLPYAATALATRPLLRGALRLRVVAAERIPAGGPLVVVANHESNLDGFALIAAFGERRLCFLAAAHLFERPAVGRYLRAIGALPVEEDAANLQSFKRALATLRGGGTVAVFPKGGIGGDEVQGGAAYLALKTEATLLPVHLAGTAAVWPPRRAWPRPAAITVRIGRPERARSLANGSSTTRLAVAEVNTAIERLLDETRAAGIRPLPL